MQHDNISIIVATDRKRGIGKDNKLPWHLPNDLKYFRETTVGNIVVMGRKTFESFGRLLPQRTNVILTRNRHFKPETEGSYIVARSIEEVLRLADVLTQEIFIIGGEQIYREFLPYTSKIYLTKVDGIFDTDAKFPGFKKSEWFEVSKERVEADKDNPYPHTFYEYKRK